MIMILSRQYLLAQIENIDSISAVPNSLSYGIDKQLNIYGFNFLMNYRHLSNFGNLTVNQKYIGTAYSAGNTILQDEEDFSLLYDYPVLENFSILSSGDFVLISNQGSTELNALRRGNILGGIRFNPIDKMSFDLMAGAEDNTQMEINSRGGIFRINGYLDDFELEGYRFSGKLKGELLSLNMNRVNRTLNFNSVIYKQFDLFDIISANISYRILDRYNAFKRDAQYIADNNLDFDYSLEARFNNMLVSDVNLSFGLNDNTVGLIKLYFSQNNIERFFHDYVPGDPRTGVRQYRNQLRVSVNPEIQYKSMNLSQMLGFLYNFESDENSVQNINNISQQEFNLLKSRSFELDNISTNFRIISKTMLNLTKMDTVYLSGMSSITRFDTPSQLNNSDRDEFLGLVSAGYGRRVSEIISVRLDAEMQFNHQVNLSASRSASNFWMRSIKLAPTVIIQTKSFFMRPQPYVLANYTVYDFEGFAPGVRSFSLRQIGYNDSLAIILSKNLYLGTRIDLIYKETGTLFWSDFKESPINGNLKLFYKFYVGYYDDNFNIAVGARYFNLTQKNFRASAFVNSDYKTESYAPEVIISAEFFSGATLKLNGWYEFQIINDGYRNEIPNLILNTSIKL